MHNLFLVYFVKLYMFRAYLGQSSGGTTVCIQQLVLIILFRWLSVVLVGLEWPRPGTGTWHQLYRAARGLRKLQYATRFH